ncbi:arylsulfatase B-like [Pseudomyrmex gracilis]|uniref:arylsulfatase B-like n=1 Tax=Pseudomyrmex gracilis TaxID=219809 RepID=UPI000995C8BD|nr:arylsulfatase B-like [Pseudomyrmex gracilis]
MYKALSFVFLTVLSTIGVYRWNYNTYSQPPHIVVIIADDLGWNDVGFRGVSELLTPNIDALAYNGVILNRHYTLPICTPSRTAFLTGQYAIRTGMQGFPLRGAEPRGIPLNVTLLPQYLQRLGYATHLVGKWHVGYHTRNHGPTRRGFDTFFGYYSGFIEYFSHLLIESNQTGYDLHRIAGDTDTVEYRNDYAVDMVTTEAENIISSHNPEKPLYLQLAHLAPHSTSAEEVMEVRNWTETNITFGYIDDINRRKYASVIGALDESVGRVIDALNKADMLKNSIVIFISDNGAQTEGFMHNYGSNYPLRGLKLSLFEGGVRGVACVYSNLIAHSSRVSKELFHITDWLPTLYSAAGGNPNDLKQFDLDGIDQWAMIARAKRSKRKSILVNIDEKANSEAAIVKNYKLVRDTSDYHKHYGKRAYREYNFTRISTSPAATAIASISKYALDPTEVRRLRNEATITCDDLADVSNCANRTCLFDVYKDPCENTDLSASYPTIVKKLSAYIDSYKSILMKQTNAPVDPAGFPYNFNGTWMPWLPDTTVSVDRQDALGNERNFVTATRNSSEIQSDNVHISDNSENATKKETEA